MIRTIAGVLIAAWIAALFALLTWPFFGCKSFRYIFAEEQILGGDEQEGLRFLERAGDVPRVVLLYKREGECLQLEAWARSEEGGWRPTLGSEAGEVWLQAGPELLVADEEFCLDDSAPPFPQQWAVSPSGRTLAWLWGAASAPAPGPTGESLKIASLTMGRFPEPGDAILVEEGGTAPIGPLNGLVLLNDDRVLQVGNTGSCAVWNRTTVKLESSIHFRALPEAEAFSSYDGVVTSANFRVGRVFVSLPDGKAAPLQMLSITDLSELAQDSSIRGTLAAGPNRMVAVGTSRGTFGVAQLDVEDNALRVLVEERASPLEGKTIDRLAWIDSRTLAVAGSGGIHAVPLRVDASGEVSVGETYPIVTDEGILRVGLLEIDQNVMAYGTQKKGPRIGRLLERCEDPSWREVWIWIGWVSTGFATLASAVSLIGLGWSVKGRKERVRAQDPIAESQPARREADQHEGDSNDGESAAAGLSSTGNHYAASDREAQPIDEVRLSGDDALPEGRERDGST